MESRELQKHIAALRSDDEDAVIIYVGARGPNLDMPDGNMMAATLMMPSVWQERRRGEPRRLRPRS